MGKKSRTKGRRLELFVRNSLRAAGAPAERRSQGETAKDRPDVQVRGSIMDVAIECKSRATQCSLSYLIKELEQLHEHNPEAGRHYVVAKLDRNKPVVIGLYDQWVEDARDLSG